MKLAHILAIVFSTVFLNFCCAEQEASEPSVTPIKEIEVKELNFDDLPKESKIGNLSELVKDETSFTSIFEDRIKSHVILYPYAEGLAYVNGQLCHVGNYPQSIIYTVLEGPYYGTQTTTTRHGVVLYVNYDYVTEYTVAGVVLHHYYSDSEVITGSNQIIKFR